MKRLIAVVVPFLYSVCLVASSPQPAGVDPSGCEIMTKSDVEAVLRVSVDAGAPLAGSAASLLPKNARSCVYRRPGTPEVAMLATITVTRADPAMYDSLLHNYQSPELAALGLPRPVAGLGEKAAYVPTGRQLLVYVNGYLVNISALTGSVDQAQMLARLAIARLR
jgi:hypothetical protein